MQDAPTSEPRGGASLSALGRLLWKASDRYAKTLIAFALLAAVAAAIVTSVAPVALKFTVDEFSASEPSPSIFLWIGLYALAQWIARILAELKMWSIGRAERRLHRSLSDLLFNHVMHLPLRYHLERQTGSVLETLTNGLTGNQLLLYVSVNTVLPVIVQLLVVATVLSQLSQPVFMGMFLVALVLYALAFGIGAAKTMAAATTAAGAQVHARGVMTDSILNYETVKYFSGEQYVRERHGFAQVSTEREWAIFFRVRTKTGAIAATIFAAFLLTASLYAGREVLQGRMTPGDFVLVNAYILQLVQPVEMMGYALQQFAQGLAFLQKLMHMFLEKTELHHLRAPSSAKRTQSVVESSDDAREAGSLEFRNVHLSYRDRSVLKGVSFCLPAGRTLGVVGTSGAGKTTLVRLLMRLMDPDEGEIRLDGVPVSDLPLPMPRPAVAVVPQDALLFNDTIEKNIEFGKLGSSQAEIEHAARVANLHDFICSLPEGYKTVVGERGVKLSGGERQRLSIARAALRKPRIYVFDEATSSLDSRTEQEIVANLRDLSRQATTLVIAHRLSTIVHADQIIVLHEGQVAEAGSHGELLQLGGHYAALWESQNPGVRAGHRSAADALRSR